MLLLRRWILSSFVVLLGLVPAAAQAQTNYTTIVVFGDSLSDTGNIANLVEHVNPLGIRYPSDNKVLGFDYTDGRFTDGADTQPAAQAYFGVWVEQLAASLPAHPTVKDALDGGTNYAYGDATTGSGTTTESETVATISVSITLHNMGQQVQDYLASKPTPNAQTLYVIWGGANDLYQAVAAAVKLGQDPTAAATAAAATAVTNEIAMMQALSSAGATNFMVVNLPPLGVVPDQLTAGSTAAETALNTGSAVFNAGLAQAIAALKLSATAQGANLTVYQPDIFSLYSSAGSNPVSVGLGNETNAAQNITTSPDIYLSWDGLHPTTTGHHLVAALAANLLTPLVASAVSLSVPPAAIMGQNATLTAKVTSTASTAVPTGLVTFYIGQTAIGSGALNASGVATATFNGTPSVGSPIPLTTASPYNITATYAGDTTFAVSTAAPQPLAELASAIATTTSVASSAANANAGAAVTFTATVAAASSSYGPATGTVTFLDGTTTLGTGTLSGGVATYTTSSLSAGTHNITASYAASGVFAGSTSAALTETITAPGFTATANPTSLTIASGASGTTTLTVVLVGGYTGTVTPACGTLPAHFACSIAVQNTQVAANTTAYTLTIATNAASGTAAIRSSLQSRSNVEEVWSAGLLLPSALGLLGMGLRRRKHLRGILGLGCALLAGVFVIGLTGCGGSSANNNAAAGSYTVPVVFTASSSAGGTAVAPQTVNIAVTVH